MKSSFKIPAKIEIKDSTKEGRGVFATSEIKKGETVEISPLIILTFEELVDTKWNTLFNYYFWMDDYVALALGYGSLYNHSENPNCEYLLAKENKTIIFTATVDILKGEEILFNYRQSLTSKDVKGKEKTKTPLWFEVKK